MDFLPNLLMDSMINRLEKGPQKCGPWREYPPPKVQTMNHQLHTGISFKQTGLKKFIFKWTPFGEVPWLCDPKDGMI